ncbi:TIGR02680 family protein [Myceligenerans xiligouense]|uniref:Uncharacterized protein (TIGR02680 family) n=1 Tax=Myceligenerans xiligouense TaxID=253184 RepID=A0A3N4YQI7_9MICO|nr:TIGR02680 family protein [Myceligenerans xiligouense]RPF21756.1 uncharacterized protein (TIGR02680 family) [Myceligenerans xiligouense]
MTGRWQPTRAGLLNVWRYVDEILSFADGRLLLRGPNGSGKSKALELLLPFLLDANLRASRLSTFGSGDRTMHWNLMGQGATGSTRVGYVWLEVRREGREVEEHVTVGARLQASKSDTSVRVAYFVAHARVGHDLDLQPDREPLTVAHLKAALVGRGTVFEGDAGGYRDDVRATLFPGMERDRYDALVQALLQLRRPKLSERLDPENLSTFLSSALPPVDATRIEELAEGFERLDQRRAELAELAEEVRAISGLLDTARTYGAMLLRERARAVTSAATEVDSTSRALRDGAVELQTAEENEVALGERRDREQTLLGELHARREALEDSDAYREGRDLVDLRKKAEQSAKIARRSQEDAADAQQQANRLTDRATVAQRTSIELQHDAENAHAEAVRRAEALGVPHLVGSPDLGAHLDVVARHVAEMDALVGKYEQAVADRDRCEADLTGAKELRAEARTQLDDARALAAEEEEGHVEAVVAWSRNCAELRLDEPALLAALDDGELRSHVQGARYETRLVRGREREEEARLRDAAAADARRLETERDELVARPQVAPDQPPYRSGHEQRGPGARLWQVVDFHDDVAEDDRAGLEAALEASGLLDAWLDPDGSLWPVGHDTVLAPIRSVDGPRLSQALRPDLPADSVMTAAAVVAVLEAVALNHRPDDASGSAPSSWVSPDGRWGLGVAHGAWAKSAAQYIGGAARERHRAERLALLAGEIADCEQTARAHAAAVRRLEDRLAQVDAEASQVPSSEALDVARQEAESASVRLAERERAERKAADAVTAARHAVDQAHTVLVTGAQERRLPTTRGELKTISEGVAELRELDRERDQAAKAAEAAGLVATEQVEEAERASMDAGARRDRATEDAREADQDETRLRMLEERLGGAYTETVAELKKLADQITDARGTVEALNRSLNEVGRKVARLGQAQVASEEAHQRALRHRSDVSDALVRLLRTTLAADAGVTEPLARDAGVTAVLDEARRLDRTLPATRPNDSAQHGQNRLMQRVHESREKLVRRAQIHLEPDDDVVVPVAVLPGRRLGIADLLNLVVAEEAQAGTEITEGEHALFEKALTGDTRRHLSETIRDADALVHRMNDRLKTVRTASGVQVRLRWDVRDEASVGLREARALLLRNPAMLTEEENDALHTFFRQRIDDAHVQDSGRSWAEQLATVFDYTQWHRFQVQLARPDTDGWRTLTKKTHSVLSGGEKAIALHLPLFAALAAHYEATPAAPRLILLDEVFVGIDEMNRGQIFALLRDLDLDLVLTSDHEWACYPEVPEIAIHALAAGADDDAVTTTRFIWRSGRLMQEDDLPDGILTLEATL